jgi:hypothetical protein
MRGLRYQPGDVVNYDDSAEDRFGNPARVETGRRTTRGSLQQRSSAEATTTGPATVTVYDLFLPPDVDIDAGDEWEQDGHRYAVDGAPVAARNGRGVHHIEAVVRFVGTVT